MGSVADRLWSEVASYVAAEGVELYDLEVLGQGPGRIVRVTLESEALGVEHIADLSRGISRSLDDLDPFEGASIRK